MLRLEAPNETFLIISDAPTEIVSDDMINSGRLDVT
jgi:hypothetical protein